MATGAGDVVAGAAGKSQERLSCVGARFTVDDLARPLPLGAGAQ
jgi:hypothetical protein